MSVPLVYRYYISVLWRHVKRSSRLSLPHIGPVEGVSASLITAAPVAGGSGSVVAGGCMVHGVRKLGGCFVGERGLGSAFTSC